MSTDETPIQRNPLPQYLSALMGIGSLVASLIVAWAAMSFLRDQQDMRVDEAFVRLVLLANLALIAGLAAVVTIRVAQRFVGRRYGEPAPRLHLRFLAMFSIAAAAPTILVAVFLGGVLTRGVEYWFGERVSTVVENSAAVARETIDRETAEALEQMPLMAFDLNQDGPVDGFTTSRIQYVQYLRQQTIVRGFRAAYIIDGEGTILARAETSDAVEYTPPSANLFALAQGEDGDVAVSDADQATTIGESRRAIIRLAAYDDAYLYVYLNVDLSLLRRAQDALNDYRRAQEAEAGTRDIFVLVYLEAAILILLGAIWLALSAATRVVRPVANLVAAAERVRRGDLDSRVPVKRADDEIAALGRAFNRMTRQLRGQRRELIASHTQSERRRAFTEAVLSGVSAGVIGLDEDGKITLVNRSACSLLGVAEDELIGADLSSIAPELEATVLEARRRPGYLAERQTEIISADESVLSLNVRAAMNEDVGLVVTFDDVTRLVSAQRNAAWRDVARRIAHEIKNPLTPIQLSAERLQRKYRDRVEGKDQETFDRCTETIIRQVGDIGRMVDEFSTFARMPTPMVEPVEMGELVQEVVFAQRVASPNIRFAYNRPPVEIFAECDARLASQALANILKNASESVSARCDRDGEKGDSGRISVSLVEEQGMVRIEIRDNGLGWPMNDRERLTEPYMTTREKGTGLGLAIVKRVMEDHHGHLELDTPDDALGAIVRLLFPSISNETQPSASETAEA